MLWETSAPYNCLCRYSTVLEGEFISGAAFKSYGDLTSLSTAGGLQSVSIGAQLFVTGSQTGQIRVWALPHMAEYAELFSDVGLAGSL